MTHQTISGGGGAARAGGYAMRAYRYGCPAKADFDEAGMAQLRLANDLWNALVEIEHSHSAAVAAIWAGHPEVAAGQAAVDDAGAQVEKAAEQVKADRIQDRSTKPRREARERLAAVKTARREAREHLRAAKTAAMKAMRPEFAAARGVRAAAIKAARQEFAARGLYWGTYNDICQRRFPAAVRRVEEQRKRGLPAQLRFHRFDGSGTLTTQVMWQAGDPLPVPALLASPQSKWRNVACLSPWGDPAGRPRGASRYGTLRVRISAEHHLALPVVLHRMMPADAEVKEVKVSRQRIAGQSRVSAVIVCRVPEPAPQTSGAVVDVDFGWASGGAGIGLCVARIGAGLSSLPPPPESIASLVTEGDWHEVWVPAAWRDLAGRPDSIRAHRDELFNAARDAALKAMRGEESLPAAVHERREKAARNAGHDREIPLLTAAMVARWRSPGKLANLTRWWPEDHPLAAVLEEWRQRDRHLWEYEAHERDQILARRRDAYRKVAAWIASAARLIVIKDLDVASARRKPQVGSEDSYEARGGRRNSQFAAPAELRSAIENAARSRGVRVIYRSYREDGSDE